MADDYGWTPNHFTKQFYLLIKWFQSNVPLLLIVGLWTQRGVPRQPQNMCQQRVVYIYKLHLKILRNVSRNCLAVSVNKSEEKILPSKWLNFKPICLRPSVFYLTKFSTEIYKRLLSSCFRVSQFYTTIIQQDAAVRSQFYFTAALLYMFRVLSMPIIRSTLTVSTASGAGHTSVQLPSGSYNIPTRCSCA